MKFTIVSLSASDNSVGRTCAKIVATLLDQSSAVELIDIRSLPPVWVDDRELDARPREYAEIDSKIRHSDGVILVWPIYCYAASSPAKAFTELFASAFKLMPVAMVVAAGSVRSHLAIGNLMLGMMFEQSTICFPKIVIATSEELENGGPRAELSTRLQEMSEDFAKFAMALSGYRKYAA